MPSEQELSSNLRKLMNRPLCIICGRPGEAEEIAKELGIVENKIQGDEIDKLHDGHTFYLGSFKLQKGHLDYYITSSLRQGIQSFTVSAAVLISILLPRFVIHAGVCAGYDDPLKKLKMNLTDVVLGEAAINYEEGKWEGELFRPDYNRVTASAGDLQAFADSNNRRTYHYGEYISGSAVRTDAGAQFARVRNGMNRNAIALDMEASAFIQLCAQFGNDYAKCLGVVKGISDFGNSEKGQNENTYFEALRNTAIALQEWVTYRIPEVKWVTDESHEPGAKIVPGYYKNFVCRVLDNFCEGMEITLKHNDLEVIPAEEIKGFMTVLPKDRNPASVSEMGNVTAITHKYDICEIKIGRKQAFRYLYYKSGYMMDWSRCCNSLVEYADGVYQVGVFERELSKHPYYSAVVEGPARAIVMTWEETEAWLSEDAAKQKPVEEKTVYDVAEGSEIQDSNGPSKVSEHSGGSTQTKTAALERTPPSTEKRAVDLPRSSNSFPGDHPGATNNSTGYGQVQKSKTGFANVRKRVSFTSMRNIFGRKHPPVPVVQKDLETVGR